MKSAEYWAKRAEQIHNEQFRKTDEYMASVLKREYDRAAASIRRDIEVFYQRFSLNNQIDLAEARKLLNSDQLKEFRMSLEEFTELAKNNPDGRWTQILNNVYYKVRVTRLQALLIQIESAIQVVNMKQNEQMTDHLVDIYTDTYYRTIYEVQKGLNIGTTFAKVENVKKIIQMPWLEENYSQRIWKDNAKLVQTLQTQITQAIIRGDSINDTAKIIADRMEVGYRAAQRLVRTEASHIQNGATFDGYKASGVVQKYEYLATLDSRTSQMCRAMDNRVFLLSEKEDGVNFPPLHSNCRSTTVPYFDDEIDPGQRIARDDDGKSYFVPGGMSYQEWNREYVRPNRVPKSPPEPPVISNTTNFKSLHDFERSIKNNDYETAAIFDTSGNEVWRQKGKESSVDLDYAIDKGMVTGNIVTHNHPGPGDESFSKNDIYILVGQGAAEMRAISPNYIHSAKVTNKFRNMKAKDKGEQFQKAVDEIYNQKISEYRLKVKNNELTSQQAAKLIQHDIWTEFSKKTGWIEYKRMKLE